MNNLYRKHKVHPSTLSSSAKYGYPPPLYDPEGYPIELSDDIQVIKSMIVTQIRYYLKVYKKYVYLLNITTKTNSSNHVLNKHINSLAEMLTNTKDDIRKLHLNLKYPETI